MDWAQLREVAEAGVEIGAHSVTHPDLRTLDGARLGEEVSACRKALEDGLGRPVSTFAYPFGFYDGRVKNAVREAQKLGITTMALIDTDCDPDEVDLPIPGNDDSIRSIELIMQLLADAVLAGKTAVGQPKDQPVEEPVPAVAEGNGGA